MLDGVLSRSWGKPVSGKPDHKDGLHSRVDRVSISYITINEV